MNLVIKYLNDLSRATVTGWNRFWFLPERHETLALIRIFTGLMIFYTHFVWTTDLAGFFGAEGRIDAEFVVGYHGTPFAWTHWLWFNSPAILWSIHIVGLVVVLLFAIGFATRITSVLTFLLAVSYVHRVPGALFGLDQINTLLAMYLMIGDCGHRYSVDEWFATRRGRPLSQRSTSTNIATRLIQLHMCIVYLFAAIGKLQGETWWAGQAMWLSFANYEYQTLDMLWLGKYPLLINLMTHITLFWEAAYVVLIWPRYTRPLMLVGAIPLHLGIALCMGMITFGLIMLVGNMAFISPLLTRNFVDWTCKLFRQGRGGESSKASAHNKRKGKSVV